MNSRILIGLIAVAAFAEPKIAFEVVSVKPTAPGPMNQIRMMRSSDPGRVRFAGFSLRALIRTAYRIKDFQVEGPEWIDSARFDVEGKFPEGVGEDKVPEMLQTMLADRFKLTVHHENKEHGIFALVAAKGGPRLKPTEAPAPDPNLQPSGPGGGPSHRGMMTVQVDGDGAHVKAMGTTLSNLSELISRFAERPIIDMTGIQGEYDFDLVLSPEALQGGTVHVVAGGGDHSPEGGNPADAASGKAGTIHEAVQAYGLKLEARKAPMDMLIVDHIEKTPTEN